MIHLYFNRRCTSSPKAIKWFRRYHLDIVLHPVAQLTREDLINALMSTDRGFTDLVKHHERLNDKDKMKVYLLKQLPFNEAIEFLKLNPHLIRTPVIIEGNKTLIGYNPDQIRMFLPKEYRRTTKKSYFRD